MYAHTQEESLSVSTENNEQEKEDIQEAAPEAATPEQETRKDGMAALREHLTEVALGLSAVLIVAIGVTLYQSRKQSSLERSFQMLSVAQSGQQLSEIVQQYPSTPAAQVAMLTMAKAYYDGGNYNQASVTYSDFEKKYPKHYMLAAARLGRIHCTEALGMTEEALNQYSGFVTENTNSFVRAEAIMGKGRCLQQLGRLAEAKALYEEFVAANPDSAWTQHAETMLADVTRDMKRAAPKN